MSSIIPGYEYDIFISYRQKDNKGDRWVSEFVEALRTELDSTFKEEISVYFDINPHDGLKETHDVDASLKDKLKCLVFIPIISRTYCDPKSFAWEHEFKPFIEQASQDQFGLKIKLPNGNVANRILPVRIHELDPEDIILVEVQLGFIRSVDFIYHSQGVNRPLRQRDDDIIQNPKQLIYRDQINKVANAIVEVLRSLKSVQFNPLEEKIQNEEIERRNKKLTEKPFRKEIINPKHEIHIGKIKTWKVGNFPNKNKLKILVLSILIIVVLISTIYIVTHHSILNWTKPKNINPTQVSEQLLKNTDLETNPNEEYPDERSWFTSGTGNKFISSWTDEDSFSLTHSIKIARTTIDTINFWYWVQTYSGKIPFGKTLKLTAIIKGVKLTGAGVALVIRCDGAPDQIIQFETTEGLRKITGTFNWTTYSVNLSAVDSKVRSIVVFLLYLQNTTGTVFFDDIMLTTN
jgi:hypothetical protein